MDILESKKGLIDKDLQEMEKMIAPKHQQASKNVQTLKVSAEKHIQQSRTALMKQGERLQKEIDVIIQDIQSEMDDMTSEIDAQEDAINHATTEMERTIINLKMLLNTTDVCLVFEHKSRNEEFRILPFPFSFQIALPILTPQEIKRELRLSVKTFYHK